ncbi:MAG: hypothetical protein ACKPE6_03525 [Gammaproteobacteria bacterium]
MISVTSAAAETRGFAISRFITAAYAETDNCPGGGNGGATTIRTRILLGMGYSEEEAARILADNSNELAQTFNLQMRGRRNGEPADVAIFPTSVPDPGIELAGGRYAYGFNLNDKAEPGSFEDPESGELGVDNSLWRAVGCFEVFRVRVPTVPYTELNDAIIDSMPAWLISISGEDLDKDGDVTVTFDRALNILMRDAQGGILRGASYTIDPDPRSHNVFRGRIRDGWLTIEPGDLFLLGESPFLAVLRFTRTHLRLRLEPDGALRGIIGGYQPFVDMHHYMSMYVDGSFVNLPGVYYAMKRLAEAEPDPRTGENTAISAAHYLEAVPAHLVGVEDVARQQR